MKVTHWSSLSSTGGEKNCPLIRKKSFVSNTITNNNIILRHGIISWHYLLCFKLKYKINQMLLLLCRQRKAMREICQFTYKMSRWRLQESIYKSMYFTKLSKKSPVKQLAIFILENAKFNFINVRKY